MASTGCGTPPGRDLLRGDYEQSEYGRVILPFVVLRRLDCVLESTKAKVLQRARQLSGKVANIDPLLRKAAGQQFYNVSPLDLRKTLDDPTNLAENVRQYILAFSPAAQDVLEKFDLPSQIERLDRARLSTDASRNYVAAMLATGPIREVLRLGISGGEGLANNLPSSVVKELSIPLAPREAQDDTVRKLSDARRRIDKISDVFGKQIALLRERRQAIITAAVAGQLDIPGAA